jgi:hypothetical protein
LNIGAAHQRYLRDEHDHAPRPAVVHPRPSRRFACAVTQAEADAVRVRSAGPCGQVVRVTAAVVVQTKFKFRNPNASPEGGAGASYTVVLNNNKHAYASVNDCFTHLRALLVLHNTAAFWPTQLALLGIIPPTEVTQRLVLILVTLRVHHNNKHAYTGQLNSFTHLRVCKPIGTPRPPHCGSRN